MSVPLPSIITPMNNKHGMADRYLWQQKALFLNGNLAEKRQAEKLGMLAHLPLSYSAQSLPPAQSDFTPCLLTMPAKPLLGSRPGCLLLKGVLTVWPSFTTNLFFCLSLTLSPPKILPTCLHLTFPCYCLLPWACHMPLFPPTYDCPMPSHPLVSSEYFSIWPPPISSVSSRVLSDSFPQHIIQLRVSPSLRVNKTIS